MNEFLETVKAYGPLIGYLTGLIGLYTLIKNDFTNRTTKYIAQASGKDESEKADVELKKELTELRNEFMLFIKETQKFQDRMEKHIDSQNEVNQKVMADIIETAYDANRNNKTISRTTWRHVSAVYPVYHSPEVHGNSYISSIYEEMEGWEKIDG